MLSNSHSRQIES